MRTADHQNTRLHYWVSLNIGVEDIWRQIRCCVSPAVTNLSNTLKASESSQFLEPLSFLLRTPWLYSINAQLSIRNSKIEVDNLEIGEVVRAIVGPELVYCHDHNLLMFLKDFLPVLMTSTFWNTLSKNLPKEESSSSDSDSFEKSKDNLSDIEEPGFS